LGDQRRKELALDVAEDDEHLTIGDATSTNGKTFA